MTKKNTPKNLDSDLSPPAIPQSVEPNQPDQKDDNKIEQSVDVTDALSFKLTLLIPKKDVLFKNQKSKKAKTSALNRLCVGEILASLPAKHQKHISLGETLLERDEFWGFEVSALALEVTRKNERAAKILACLYSLGEVCRLSKNGRFELHISST